jgi:hypothetical protein
MVRKKIEKSKDTELKKTQGRRKQQTQHVVEPVSHDPMETSDPYSGVFTSMMPMIMMVMMLAIIAPMLKGVTKE